MSFVLSKTVNPEKVFLTRKSDVIGRWDPSYFIPSVVALEKQIRMVTPHRLRDFVVSMAGGATPATTELETHYTEGNDGIPFIRVQNLSTTGKLNLENCKQITRQTHMSLLQRSQLHGGELLVKITGVGRMAVASVVPEGFEGNINQHIAAIRTKSIQTSETLAAYLNLDIAERLASRRSTGGTRPALDYPALLSIPVVFDEHIPKLILAAVQQHDQKIFNANNLLRQIDGVLLAELGITPKPARPNTIENRIFKHPFSEVTGGRLDPFYYHPYFKQLQEDLLSGPHAKVGDVALLSEGLWDQKSLFSETFPYIEISNVNMEMGQIGNPIEIPVAEAPSRARMLVRPGDLLVSLTRPTRRAIAFTPESIPLAVASNGFAVLRGILRTKVLPEFLFHVLRSCLCIPQFAQRSSGGSYPAITEEQLLKIIIPHPGIKHQEQIVRNLNKIQTDARELRRKASVELEEAKKAIETMILGEGD